MPGGNTASVGPASQPANLHSIRSLVSCLERDGVNMAEGGNEVRVEERLKITIGELREH